eukprot:TRINITY_DN9046_c0_g1_i1.p1 TRINITY_DN9046_c0_g1~~TRINITY_DN9046_c0_g1_i1.p1  ORF type:complete len:644 (+),score=163.70 TRINITY_DN9046_c0_g1_i1:101-2032(+)
MATSQLSSKQLTVGAGLGSAAAAAYYLLAHTNAVRDVGLMKLFIGVQRSMNEIAKREEFSIMECLEERMRQHPDKEALVFLDDDGSSRSYTWRQVDAESNRVAQWALREGIRRGHVVSIMLDNRPEFVFTWMGLAKVGATIAMINTYLKGEPLAHCLSISKASHYIIGDEHLAACMAVKGNAKISPTIRWFSISVGLCDGDEVDGVIPMHSLLRASSTLAVPAEARAGVSPHDKLFYIYTSGTTGFPKASIISHVRAYAAAATFGKICVTENDRFYTPLPLYHSSGGIIGVGMTMVYGCTLVFRRKFSARRFWSDCKEHKCTVVQYIGELCRYLLNQPHHPDDNTHRVRLAVGNGLRPDVWKEFESRFNIKKVIEFYAATESNVAFINTTGQFGAVGIFPYLYRRSGVVAFVKFDVATEKPIRNRQGFCIECKPGEVGEVLGKIVPGDTSRQVLGYTDKKASDKKMMRDVFVKGDLYFRTGDLLKYDEDGYVFFVDRIGDTFRWKGENVATSEVANVISLYPGIDEVNVYGVNVPNQDGRAGMAAVVLKEGVPFDLNKFYTHVLAHLPKYAAPLFLRVQPQIQVTTTFKHQKVHLVKEGFNPTSIKDPLYHRNDKLGKFVPLDSALYNVIVGANKQQKIQSRL